MATLKDHVSNRRFQIFLILLTAGSLTCTQIPLLNYLGFEFSAAIALAGSFFSGLLTLSYAVNHPPDEHVVRLFLRSSVGGLFLLLAPLAIMSLNAFVVKNCSFVDGLTFYFLGPVPAMLFMNSAAVFLAVSFKKWRKTVFSVFTALILVHIPLVTLTSPQIFAFNPLLGFFPGVTYDESLRMAETLSWYRVTTLIATGTIIVAAGIIHRARTQHQGLRVAARSREGRMVLAGLAVLLAAYLFSDRLGFSSSEEFIRRQLGGEFRTEHFTIIYPAERIEKKAIEEIALRHEFYFNTIARELRILPVKRITSFLYDSPRQKSQLVGAGGTNIAKPWLWQLHINSTDVEGALKHELVHIMAAEFGFPLLRISLNSGLIEGLATAVERTEYDETLHRLSAQIFAVGIRPDMEGLFSLSGFLQSHGGTSYVLAGSFCRYLIDQYGMRRFKWLYRTGSFETFYNKKLSVLIEEWRRFISQPEPTVRERTRAAYLFRRPSIFGKECARVIAEINERTREALRSGRFPEALELSHRSLALSRSPEAILQYATALLRTGKDEEAIRFGREALKDSTVAHTLLPVYLTMGDAMWNLGHTGEAANLYEALYSIHLSPSFDEACSVRLSAMGDKRAQFLREFIMGSLADSSRLSWLQTRSAETNPPPIVLYLFGRELRNSGKTRDALKTLQQIKPMRVGALEFFRLRMLAALHKQMDQLERAKMFSWESLNYTSKESHRLETEERIRWYDWLERNNPESSEP